MGLCAGKAGKSRDMISFQYLRFILFLFLLPMLSCGYTMGNYEGGSKIMHPGALSLEKFHNLTSVRDAGLILGEKIKDELNRNGYRWDFSTPGKYIIRGKVISLVERPVSYTDERYGLEYEVSCLVEIMVLEARTGKAAMKLENLSDRSTYYAGNDPRYTRTNRDIALEAVLEKISRRFVYLLNEM